MRALTQHQQELNQEKIHCIGREFGLHPSECCSLPPAVFSGLQVELHRICASLQQPDLSAFSFKGNSSRDGTLLWETVSTDGDKDPQLQMQLQRAHRALVYPTYGSGSVVSICVWVCGICPAMLLHTLGTIVKKRLRQYCDVTINISVLRLPGPDMKRNLCFAFPVQSLIAMARNESRSHVASTSAFVKFVPDLFNEDFLGVVHSPAGNVYFRFLLGFSCGPSIAELLAGERFSIAKLLSSIYFPRGQEVPGSSFIVHPVHPDQVSPGCARSHLACGGVHDNLP